MNGPISTLDRTDLKILDILQTDGRISNSKLAELVNLSPTAVWDRVLKLRMYLFIFGYEAKLNPAKLNANFLVFVEVLLDKTTPNVLDDFIDAVTQYPEIVECHMVSGGFDFLIKLRSAGMEEFRRIAGQILWQLPGVKETRSYPVMQVVKDSSKIKIKSRTKF